LWQPDDGRREAHRPAGLSEICRPESSC
jgi:hypothetical protein